MKTSVTLPSEEGDTGESATVPGAGRAATQPRPAASAVKTPSGAMRVDLDPARPMAGPMAASRMASSPAPAASLAMGDASPFAPAVRTDRRLKLFLWGDTGTGKTSLALQFPDPVVIDLEAGTEHYGHRIAFGRMKDARDADSIHAAVAWLDTHPHPYRTLIVDPFTVYWEMLQKKWGDVFLKRLRGKGFHHEFYTLQPADWTQIKADLKSFVRQLLALDMNVIVTAREKTKYAPGELMKAIGETFDGEKSLPYLFDVIVRTTRDEHGAFRGELIKDRTSSLPPEGFSLEYAVFRQCFGDGLARAVETHSAAPEPVDNAPGTPTQLPVQSAKTEPDPITSTDVDLILDYLAALGVEEPAMRDRLIEYGSLDGSVGGLPASAAAMIIAQLSDAYAAQQPMRPTETAPAHDNNDDVPF